MTAVKMASVAKRKLKCKGQRLTKYALNKICVNDTKLDWKWAQQKGQVFNMLRLSGDFWLSDIEFGLSGTVPPHLERN